MEDRYFKILEHLSNHGIEQIVDCREFIVKEFQGIRIVEAFKYLKHMCDNKHINFGYPPFAQFPRPLYLSITLKGVEYLNSFYLKEATLKSFKNQKWVNRITWLISCVSIGIAVCFGLKSNSLETQVIDLQKRVDIIAKKTSTKSYHIPKIPDTLKIILPKKSNS